MKKFSPVTSIAAPIAIKDVDTDMIIPAQHLTNISNTGYGEHLFSAVMKDRADFPLNDPIYQGAQVLITDSNFGCGSSREHAVWAIMGAGICVIIGKSFADIFSNNSGKNGLLLIRLEGDIIESLLHRSVVEPLTVKVDLANQAVTINNEETHLFTIDPFLKTCLLEGVDELDYLLRLKVHIDAFKLKQSKNTYLPHISSTEAK